MLTPLFTETGSRPADLIPAPLFGTAQLALVQYGRNIGLEVFPQDAVLARTNRLRISSMALLADIEGTRRQVVVIEFEQDGADRAYRAVHSVTAWNTIHGGLVRLMLSSPRALTLDNVQYTPWQGLRNQHDTHSVLTLARGGFRSACIACCYRDASLRLGESEPSLRGITSTPLSGLDDIWSLVGGV